jgi:hypothetical protein
VGVLEIMSESQSKSEKSVGASCIDSISEVAQFSTKVNISCSCCLSKLVSYQGDEGHAFLHPDF